MTLRVSLALSAALAALAAASSAVAQDRSFAGGFGIGTTGLGVSVEYRVNDRLRLRGAGDWLKYDHDVESDDVQYSGEIDSTTFGATAELHPWNNGWFVAAGALAGDRVVELDAAPTGPITIGGQTFTPEQAGRLEGEADLGDFAPVVGLGFDNTFRTDGRLGFRLMAGVAFGDEPSVELRSVGGEFSNDPAMIAALEEEEAEIEDDVEDLRYYPIVQAGVTWRF